MKARGCFHLSVLMGIIVLLASCDLAQNVFHVVSTSPSNAATGVAVDVVIAITFSRDLNEETIDEGAVYLQDETAVITGTFAYDERVLTFTPTEALRYSTAYSVTITTDIQNTEGNTLVGSYVWSFTTVERGISDQSEAEGNLLIVNHSTESLYLYHDGEILREIPGGAASFLVMVNNSGTAQTMKIWKVSDVSDTESPPDDDLFKRWDLVLSQAPIPPAECPIWIIPADGPGGTTSGTLSFTYPSIGRDGLEVLYSVDIYLNAKTGAKITSIAPGMTDKKIGLEYGYYVIYYLHWYDDPNDIAGLYDIGWIETATDGQPIQTLINLANDTRELEVPIYYGPNDGRNGNITIINNTDQYIKIYANNTPIEELFITTDPTAGLSILEPKGGSYTYLIPQEVYNMQAKSIVTNQILSSSANAEVIELYDYSWVVDTAISYRTVNITNNTNERLTLHDHATGEYLGYVIDAGEASAVSIDSSITDLRALDSWGELGNYQQAVASSWSLTALIAIDLKPPQEVRNLVVTEAVGQVAFSWSSPDDTDFAGVTIIRNESDYPLSISDGVAVYSGDGTSFVDSGLTSATAYYYKIWTYDTAPNNSKNGVAIAATPLYPTDVTNAAALPGDGYIELSWTNPTDSWFSGVRILRKTNTYPQSATDGQVIYTGAAEAFTDITVVNDITYYYTFFTFDSVNNYSSGIDASIIAGLPIGSSPESAAPSALFIKQNNPQAADGLYWIKPDTYAGDPFQVYCDMTTDGGGWIIVIAQTPSTDQFGFLDDEEMMGSPFSFESYNLSLAKKEIVSLISSESLIKRSDGAWIKMNHALFDGNLTGSGQSHPHWVVTVTFSDGAMVSNSRMGYSNYNNAYGGDFGVTIPGKNFDHHSANYYHLNGGCVGHYFYNYGATYNVNSSLGEWTITSSCGSNSTSLGAWFAAVR